MYGGGDPGTGVGVITGTPRVYLVFWGSTWGTSGGDPDGVVNILQNFFSGLGSNHEQWSGIALQYCQGVATGTITCPPSAAHVQYPLNGDLAGAWEDTSTDPYPSNQAPTGSNLAQEAENAAKHFGNLTQADNANAQYVVVSPSGTNPDGWLDPQTGYCAYHDNTSDPTIDGAGPVPGPDLPFTNLPYVPDAGAACAAGQVNSPGTADGVTIVESHEYDETLTDPYPATGCTDSSGSEIGDKCEFLSANQSGGPANITLASGTFPVQGMWANDAAKGQGACVRTHPTIAVANPGRRVATVGSPTSVQVVASDGFAGATLTYAASALPPGLSINPASGLISGTPTAPRRAKVTVTVSDSLGFTSKVLFYWVVNR
jgi:serine protease